MGTVRTDEFRKDAVRIALSSTDQKMIQGNIFPEDGLSRKQIAEDLGVGMSTLTKWITAHRDTDVVSVEDRELALENERLRRENRILREERDILKKATQFFTSQKPRWRSPAGVCLANHESVQVRGGPSRQLCNRASVSGDERQPARVAGHTPPPCQPQATHGHGGSGPYQGTIAPEPGQLCVAR